MMSRTEQPVIRKVPFHLPLRPPITQEPWRPVAAAGVGGGGHPKQPPAMAATSAGVTGQAQDGVGVGASAFHTRGGLPLRPGMPAKEVGVVIGGVKENEKAAPEADAGDDREVAIIYKRKTYRLGISVAKYKIALQQVGFLPPDSEAEPEPEASVEKDAPGLAVAADEFEQEPKAAEPGAWFAAAESMDFGVNVNKPPAVAELVGVSVGEVDKSAPVMKGGITLTYRRKKFRIPIPPETYKECLQRAGLLY